MVEEKSKIVGTDPQEPDAKPIQLIITAHPDGRIEVGGPIYDRAVCYSLLELAREAIYELKIKSEKPLIHKGGIMNFARRIK